MPENDAAPSTTTIPAASSGTRRATVEHSVLDRWATVVAEHPEAVAVVGAGRSVTYREADRLTSALALRLADELTPDDLTGAGVGPVPGGAPVPVGLMAGQTVETLLGVIALVKAGRLVVILDGHLPEARVQHICALAGIREVLADQAHRERAAALVADPAAVLPVDTMLDDCLAIAEGDEPIAAVPAATERGGTDGVTIVFTSGSTGMPKGVVLTHRQELVDTASARAMFALTPEDRVALVLPLGFAAGFMLALTTLLAGASTRLIDPRDTGLDHLLTWIAAEGVTTLNCTPHLLRSIVDATEQTDTRLHGLRYFSTVGEAVTGRDVAAIRPFLAPTADFFNWTGSSEMGCLAYERIPAGAPVPDGTVSAGVVAPGREVRILREDGSLADVGETGQLVCVSDAMTSGYWGAYEQTVSRLGADEHGVPTWRQGDLARVDADGRVTLLGRADDAVKVRGYLVEPSEVEAAITAIDAVQEAVVTTIVAPPAATRLVAYVVTRAGRRSVSPAALRKELRAAVPEYMVPSDIVPMVALPRNERGKVDRAQLPEPTAVVTELSERTHDQWELVVAQIWAEVLGLHAVGLDDDFAALGGDSLAIEEMLAAIDERLGVDLRSSELLEHPTLREFARRVRAGTTAIPSHPDVMKLSSGGTGTPIFCVSGAGALGLTFLPLAKRFAERDVYAFQQHGLERRAIPDWSVPAAARRYLELMRVVRPRGPYLLVGHSLGGLVALEIARILAAAGETVEHVILLDTYLPRSAGEQDSLEFGRLPQQQSSNGMLERIRRMADRQLARVVPGGLAPFQQIPRRLRAYTAGVLRFDGQHQFDAFFDQAAIAVKRYRMQPYDGRATFVQADGNPDGPEAWAPFLIGRTAHPRLASEHSSLLREPNVADLAALLRTAIGDGDGEGEGEDEPSAATPGLAARG